MSRLQLTLWISASALYLLIFIRALHEKALYRYKAFYAYVGFVTAVTIVRAFIYWKFGFFSTHYFYAYHLTSLPMPIFQLVVLLDLYRRFIGYSKISWKSSAKFITVALVMAAPVAWQVFGATGIPIFLRYGAFTLLIQVAACLIVCQALHNRRDVDFGRNLKGIFMGIASLVAFQTLNFAALMFGDVNYPIFNFFTQFIYFVALAVFAYALWNYDPVRALESVDGQRFDKLNHDVQQAVKTFLTPR